MAPMAATIWRHTVFFRTNEENTMYHPTISSEHVRAIQTQRLEHAGQRRFTKAVEDESQQIRKSSPWLRTLLARVAAVAG